MELSLKRINELQDFKDDFNKQLQSASDRYEENKNEINDSKLLLTINDINDSTERDFNEKKIRKKINKLSVSYNILQKIPPWKPNKLTGDYINKFIRNENEKDLSPWEIDRMPLLIRSYEKEENMLNKKNFICKDLYNSEFDKNPYKKSGENDILKSPLSSLGKKIICNFIKDNEKREEKKLKNEKLMEELKHSKRPENKFIWKPSNHVNDQFLRYPIDNVLSFKPQKNTVKLISHPWRYNRMDGTYFDKDIHLIS